MIRLVAAVISIAAAWSAWRQRVAVERESRRFRRECRHAGRWE